MTMTTGRLGITGAMKSLDDPPKKPSNSSRAGAIDLDHHSDHSRRRSDDYHARIIGQDLKKLKKAIAKKIGYQISWIFRVRIL